MAQPATTSYPKNNLNIASLQDVSIHMFLRGMDLCIKPFDSFILTVFQDQMHLLFQTLDFRAKIEDTTICSHQSTQHYVL